MSIRAHRYAKALAELTDCFLERHGCFPLDNARWKAAMQRAYDLVGQPNTPARETSMEIAAGKHPEKPMLEPWTPETSRDFIEDWNLMVEETAAFCERYAIPKPEMIFRPDVHRLMNAIADTALCSTIIYRDIKIRFGTFELGTTFTEAK